MTLGYQRLLFVMPDPQDGEAFIAALAAISAYITQMEQQGIGSSVVLVCRRSWLVDLLVPPSFIVVDETSKAGTNYDVAVDLNVERAKALANATSQSAATGYAHLLGMQGANEILQLRASRREDIDITILWWGETSSKLREGIKRINPSLGVYIIGSPLCRRNIVDAYEIGDDEFLSEVVGARMVIGIRSQLTYLASCAGRTVVELYPMDKFEKSFYAKWSSAKYYMLPIDNRKAADASYTTLWRFIEQRVESDFPVGVTA